MTIKNNTITVNGLTKKIKEDGYFGEYTFKLQKTQVRIRTVEEFKKSLETKWVLLFRCITAGNDGNGSPTARMRSLLLSL